jgi:prepilin-type N-terminal cleavage/methylation domain-containing protein
MGIIMKSKLADGFTMIEMLVAATLSCVLVIGILRLYLSMVKSYNLQDIITEMNQNAAYTCKRLSEEIMQSGTYLPDSGYAVISMKSGKTDSVVIRSNPTAAFHHFVVSVSTTLTFEIDNAWGFRGITEIVKCTPSGVLSRHNINNDYNVAPFTLGVNTDSIPHQIRVKNTLSFNVGDEIFASKEYLFFKKGTNFCFGTKDNVLAENIDSLSVVFYNNSKVPTVIWDQMKYAKIYVRSRASIPDSKYTHPSFGDHYRRYVQTMDVLIRKKAVF